MKSFIFILMCFTLLIGEPCYPKPLVKSEVEYTSYCDGWEAGWAAGYCYGKTYCTAPYPPICPIPRIGEDGYQHGYNRGFLAGMAAQR